MRKIIIFIAFLFLFQVHTVNAFSDVPQNHDYHEDITYLQSQSIVEGYRDGSFHPNDNIARAEALAMLFKAKKDIDVSRYPYNSTFSDVYPSEWYYDFVTYAWNLGVVNGNPDGSFQPTRNINLAEAIKLVIEVNYEKGLLPDYREDDLLEIGPNDWHAQYMLFAKQVGLLSEHRYYHPAKILTRGELASIMYRMELIRKGDFDTIEILNEKSLSEYRIYIPKLNVIDVPVHYVPNAFDYEAALDVLWRGVGNFRYQPGVLGRTVIYGHSSYFDGVAQPYKHVFRYLDSLNPGDRIYINYRKKGYVYEVQKEEIVYPSNIGILNSRGVEELVLFTCWPRDSIAQRYVVTAVPVEV